MAKRRPGQSYLDVPTVQDAIEAAARVAAERYRRGTLETVRDMLTDHPVGSPIEAIFYAWWVALSQAGGHTYQFGFDDVGLSGQHEVTVSSGATYRLDFVVYPNDADRLLAAHKCGIEFPDIGIELDGHDFHERTPEQVAYRNQRDRDLQMAGWRIFHFSGREIVRDGEKCVQSVLEYAAEAWWDWWHRSDPQHPAGNGTTP